MKNFFPFPENGQTRIVIERVSPEIDAGRFSTKAIVGDTIDVEADILVDGHDLIAARLLYKHESDKKWSEKIMSAKGNDRWVGHFIVEKQGFYTYTIEAWVDHASSWKHEVELKVNAGLILGVELLQGEVFLNTMAKVAKGDDKKAIQDAAKAMLNPNRYEEAVRLATSEQMHEWIEKYPDRQAPFRYQSLSLYVDRKKAAFLPGTPCFRGQQQENLGIMVRLKM